MCARVAILLCLLGVACSASAVSITKCKIDDVNCMRLSAQALVPIVAAGLPEYDMKPLDPLPISKIDGSSPDLKLIASDVVVTGMKGCEVQRISRVQSKVDVGLLCSVKVEGEYEIKGKILILPLDGKGKLTVSLKKFLINVQTVLKEEELNGKKHWGISSWDYNYDLKERANIELTNLFAGSEKLTEAIRESLGESANEIVKEVGPPIIKAITGEVIDSIKHFFHHVPVEDLIIE
ncbi:circadian clock-controlled protein-like isoform X2 [Ostrinia furnacalis]|uniref:circadian clock-controlled protein-like isoform X1 n=1 Tax=Ostrinia furnacalis TaxID=93504 RepID=UPI00103C9272|nr:circadian clock-controlled protein-like isoform X1 [Ostrinia furnacalis]XP_028157407.1 circadian clock-controlled protein-like isoform X2 [Ostrinia furnacalis]